MPCVTVGDLQATEWTALSSDASLIVKATSLKGPLAHNSRANEAFRFTIERASVPMEQAQVRLMVRMPHHDRGVPGGHGPANDPDVKGLTAQPDGPGRYTVQSVDFSMAGPWLLELQVQEGAKTQKAYVGVAVGEE
jgi:hypothetical protein